MQKLLSFYLVYEKESAVLYIHVSSRNQYEKENDLKYLIRGNDWREIKVPRSEENHHFTLFTFNPKWKEINLTDHWAASLLEATMHTFK